MSKISIQGDNSGTGTLTIAAPNTNTDNTLTLPDTSGMLQTVGMSGRRNYIINGNFDVWQRGISQTSNGYGSDDRWRNADFGSTKVHSREAFALGQTDVPGNPKYYSHTVFTSVAGASNYVFKQQRIEDVTKSSGQTFTLTFYAKADAPKNIAIEGTQGFGTGGSPSAPVIGIDVQTVSLTTSWTKYTATLTFPSVSGKTLGTDGNDSFNLLFWLDASSSYDSRTNSLGQQSGTFDIAQVQLEAGTQATPFEYRSYGEELALCQRYYEIGTNYMRVTSALNDNSLGQTTSFNATKRIAPSMTYTPIFGADNSAFGEVITIGGFYVLWKITGGNGAVVAFDWTASAEL